jgi:hypothetical protein
MSPWAEAVFGQAKIASAASATKAPPVLRANADTNFASMLAHSI